jgi:hypothetical protein
MNEIEKAMKPVMSAIDRLIAEAPDDAPESAVVAAAANEQQAVEYRNHCRKVNFPSRYTGELVGEEWHSALAKVLAVVEAGGIATLYGNRGCGKTRMALHVAEIARLPKCEMPKEGSRTKYRDCVYVTAMELFLDLRSANHPKSEETPKQAMDRYEGAALLVIDEIQVRGETRFEDDTLTHVIDRRYRHGRPTIIIGNIGKEHLAKQLSASVQDRIRENGCGVNFTWPSHRKPNKVENSSFAETPPCSLLGKREFPADMITP